MSAAELDQASRVHFHFTEKLLQAVQERRAVDMQESAPCPVQCMD